MNTDTYTSYFNQILRNSTENQKPLFIYASFFTKSYPMFKVDQSESKSNQIAAMDEAIGSMVALLKDYDMYDNTLIIFISDNGAREIKNQKIGSNFPLR